MGGTACLLGSLLSDRNEGRNTGQTTSNSIIHLVSQKINSCHAHAFIAYETTDLQLCRDTATWAREREREHGSSRLRSLASTRYTANKSRRNIARGWSDGSKPKHLTREFTVRPFYKYGSDGSSCYYWRNSSKVPKRGKKILFPDLKLWLNQNYWHTPAMVSLSEIP